MKTQTIISALIVCAGLLLGGCTRTINIQPDTPIAASQAPKVNKTVGLYISAADLAIVNNAPGSKNQDLKYAPYQNLAGPITAVLKNIYTKVVSLNSLDPAAIAAQKVTMIITPTITTTSSASSISIWPSPDFSVYITTKASDVNGKLLWEESANGNGNVNLPASHATNDNYNNEYNNQLIDRAVAASQASGNALKQLEVVIRAREAQK